MLKIGEFAKLSGISIKTLRHYDAIGLLQPDAVDASSGYRFYSEAQLLTVKRIAAFKEQGFKLEQIIPFLAEEISQDSARERLLAKRMELRRLIEESQTQLAAIDDKLRRADEIADASKAEHPIRARRVDPLPAASIRETVSRTQLCVLLDEVSRYVRSHGEPQANSLIVLTHGRHTGDLIDLEVAVPIAARDIPGNERVKIGFLPGYASAASYVHRCDPYGDRCLAVPALEAWIASHGYALLEGGPIREVYMTPDQDIYGTMRLAELLIPVAAAQ